MSGLSPLWLTGRLLVAGRPLVAVTLVVAGMLMVTSVCGCAPAPPSKPSESLIERSPALAASAQPDERLAALGGATQPSAQLAALMAQARTIAKQYCGACHGDDTHEGKPEALAIFDLKQAGWFRGLDDRQLDVAISRLENKADEPTQGRFKAFVRKLRAQRKAQGSPAG